MLERFNGSDEQNTLLTHRILPVNQDRLDWLHLIVHETLVDLEELVVGINRWF